MECPNCKAEIQLIFSTGQIRKIIFDCTMKMGRTPTCIYTTKEQRDVIVREAKDFELIPAFQGRPERFYDVEIKESFYGLSLF